MALFRYKAVSATGETIEGQMEAGSREEVIGRLQDGGNIPLDAREAGGAGGQGVGALFRKADMTPAKALEIAIEGETYEYTEMYPKFRHLAVEEGNQAAVAEFDEQIAESKEHADSFRRTLEMAAKRFAALAKVEERHANHYRDALNALDKAA